MYSLPCEHITFKIIHYHNVKYTQTSCTKHEQGVEGLDKNTMALLAYNFVELLNKEIENNAAINAGRRRANKHRGYLAIF
jgi:hypothetical protein